MKILYISNHFSFPHQPGAPRPLKVAEYLASLGHDVTVITNRRHYLDETICMENGIYPAKSGYRFELKSVPTTVGRRQSITKRLVNYLSFSYQVYRDAQKLPEQDIVIVGTPPLFVPVIGLLLGVKKRTKIILEIRDLYPETAVSLGKLKSSFLEICWRKWENAIRHRYDHIVAVVPQIKTELVDQGIDADQITVITNGYDNDSSDNEDASLSVELNGVFEQYHNQLKIVYGGGMGYGINLWPILHAARFLQNDDRVVFFLFGEGEQKKAYEAFVRDEKLGNIFFFPSQPRMIIKNIFILADVLIHSFVKNPFFKCALPNKIFEYHGAGTPIIFAGLGDSADLIHNAKSGIVVEPENSDAIVRAVKYLYDHEEERKKMGENGKKYIIEQYSREIVFEKWKTVLANLQCN